MQYRINQGLPTWLVMVLAVMAGVSVANLYYCQPLLNMIREDLAMSEFQVNLMPVSTQIGYALGLLLIIPMGDMYDRRRTILVCFGVLIAALLATTCAGMVPLPLLPDDGSGSPGAAAWLLGGAFVTGFCSVAPQVFIPFVSQFSRPEHKERKVGYILSGLLTGILASRVISGYVGHLWGWRAMYYIAAIAMALSAMVLLRTFPYVEPTFRGRFTTLMKSMALLVRKHPQAITYSLRAALCFGSMLGMWACLAFRIKEAPFFQGSDVVGMLGLCGVAGALTASNAGKYIPRIGVERMNIIGVSTMLTAWVLLVLFDETYAGLIAGIIIIDIGMQCVQLSNQSATLKLNTEASSRMNTIFMVTYFIGGSLGTFLAGTLWTVLGWHGTVIAGAGMALLAISTKLIPKRN